MLRETVSEWAFAASAPCPVRCELRFLGCELRFLGSPPRLHYMYDSPTDLCFLEMGQPYFFASSILGVGWVES